MDSPLAEAWAATEASMPTSWRLDSLRCASTGLSPAERSERWVAIAIGPDNEERASDGPTAEAALEGLARRMTSASTSG